MGKRWMIIVSIFFITQCFFYLIDGTILEPRLNNIGERMVQFAGPKLEWFTLYNAILLKVITMLFIFMIIVTAVTDLILLSRRKVK